MVKANHKSKSNFHQPGFPLKYELCFPEFKQIHIFATAHM